MANSNGQRRQFLVTMTSRILETAYTKNNPELRVEQVKFEEGPGCMIY